MNIGFIYKYFPSVGGVERVMTILANEFIERGHKVTIFSYCSTIDRPFYPLNPNVAVCHLPSESKIDNDENVVFLLEMICKKEINIIVNHDTTNDSMRLCAAIKSRCDAKIITLHHGQIYLPYKSIKSIAQRFKRRNPRRLFPLLYYCYDHVRRTVHHRANIGIVDKYVLLSEAFKKDISFYDKNNKSVVIPNPLSFDELFKLEDYNKKEKAVLMVGRLTESDKRFQMALKIWEKIETDLSLQEWRMIIVGDGDARRDIENTIQKRNLKRVKLVGRADSQPYYKNARIYFMTSAFEGFPLVLLEAMQCACVPIVMDSFATVHDLISSGKDGVIVPNNDIDRYVANAKAMMLNEKQLRNMAVRCVEKSSYYRPSRIVEQWERLFASL